MTFVVTLFTMKPWIPGLGMAFQAFINSILAYTGIMRISVAQQVVFAVIYVFIIAFAVATYRFDDQQVETRATTYTTPSPKPKAKKVTYKIDLKRVITRKLVMGIADGSVEVDGREIYTAKDLRVGLFTSTDNF